MADSPYLDGVRAHLSGPYLDAVRAHIGAVGDFAEAALQVETQRLNDQTETMKSAVRMLRDLVARVADHAKVSPRYWSATQLGDLARIAYGYAGAEDVEVHALITAVLENEAYTEQQVAELIAEAKRRWPADWPEQLCEPGIYVDESERS